MELKCCICGTEFVGYGNNAEPIRKGVCCDKCNAKHVIASRFLPLRNVSYEIVKNENEKKELIEMLKENNFELRKIMSSNILYYNPENDENVVICIL
ncbi:hypothetical protein [Methanobrevibacter sp.]|uniref:hypothetical protein n=1 Tax=Methanobrevibacter sp. TaxID=66852 RepID=UPI00386564DF